MAYPGQPGQPSGWSDQSWPSPEPYQDPSGQASPAGYQQPYSAPPGYGTPAPSGYGTPAPPGYGTPGYQQPQYPPQNVPVMPYTPQPYGAFGHSNHTNGLAIASLVCSLCGLLTCGFTAPIGAILGHVARKQIVQRRESGDGMALAGIAIGWIIFAISAIFWLINLGFFAFLAGIGSSTSPTEEYGAILVMMMGN